MDVCTVDKISGIASGAGATQQNCCLSNLSDFVGSVAFEG